MENKINKEKWITKFLYEDFNVIILSGFIIVIKCLIGGIVHQDSLVKHKVIWVIGDRQVIYTGISQDYFELLNLELFTGDIFEEVSTAQRFDPHPLTTTKHLMIGRQLKYCSICQLHHGHLQGNMHVMMLYRLEFSGCTKLIFGPKLLSFFYAFDGN